MNGVYQSCLLKCRHLAGAEGLQASNVHCDRMMPAVSQSVADQLLYMSAIEMVSSVILTKMQPIVVCVAHRRVALSDTAICLSVPWHCCLGYRHTGCLGQLSLASIRGRLIEYQLWLE